jgi:hypothetical protein
MSEIICMLSKNIVLKIMLGEPVYFMKESDRIITYSHLLTNKTTCRHLEVSLIPKRYLEMRGDSISQERRRFHWKRFLHLQPVSRASVFKLP